MPAPTYLAYPTTDDLVVSMQSIGEWPEDDENSSSPTPDQKRAEKQCEIAINWMISEWERRVNWLPFLADGDDDEERTFDEISQSGYINLEGGVLSVDSLAIAGETLVEGTDYRLEPRNAPRQGKPYEEIRLLSRRRWYLRDLGQISVKAKWGYSETIPADVYGALLEAASRTVLTHTLNEQNIEQIEQDGFSKSFDVVGTIQQKDLQNIWEKTFKNIYEGYVRDANTF